MNDQQKRLIESTLQMVLNSALMSTIWQLPLWARVGLGVAAFGVLFVVLG
jgi:hypothetical protein